MIHLSLSRLLYCIFMLLKCKELICKIVQDSNRFILIRNSPVFVDKTILLKSILKYDFILLTAPHKFGKSTNLQMIKLFLSNNNQKTTVANVFRNTNIWEDREFVVKHVCKCPIIYCNFKSKGIIQSVKDVENELKMSIRDAFVEHKYILNSTKIGVVTKQRYVEYCCLQVKDFELGLTFLSKVLYIHHGKRATVLIDDYDFPITYSIFKKELDSTKTAELLFRIIDNSINLNEFVQRGVIMGSLPFKLGAQFSGLYLLEHFKFMEAKDFTPYFGFTQHETLNLLDKFGLLSFKRNVSNWYGGYSYLHSNFHIYNPWSVLMFIKSGKLDIHWVTKSSRRILYDYIEPNHELKEHITKLLNHEEVTIQAVSSFTMYEVCKLKNVQFASYSYGEDYTEDHLFLQVLLESGYLTYAQTYRVLPISAKVKFPNIEIQKVFEEVQTRLASVYPDINRH